jgi:regulator of cell morphogenesis and NO signaling
MTTSSLSPALSVNDLLRTMPDAAPVLNRLGIDLCCGGSLSLADAAAGAGLPLADLLTALRQPAEDR